MAVLPQILDHCGQLGGINLDQQICGPGPLASHQDFNGLVLNRVSTWSSWKVLLLGFFFGEAGP